MQQVFARRLAITVAAVALGAGSVTVAAPASAGAQARQSGLARAAVAKAIARGPMVYTTTRGVYLARVDGSHAHDQARQLLLG